MKSFGTKKKKQQQRQTTKKKQSAKTMLTHIIMKKREEIWYKFIYTYYKHRTYLELKLYCIWRSDYFVEEK